jgi:hypothetical protein
MGHIEQNGPQWELKGLKRTVLRMTSEESDILEAAIFLYERLK